MPSNSVGRLGVRFPSSALGPNFVAGKPGCGVMLKQQNFYARDGDNPKDHGQVTIIRLEV